MLSKIILAALFVSMVAAAYRFDPARERTLLGAKAREGPRLKLLTWNVGYADLEDDTRARTKDMRAVADVIVKQDPDAVALQELTGEEQLKVLLGHLRGRYAGQIARAGDADRAEALLVKDRAARFEEIAAGGGRFALGATFRPRADAPEVVLVSAHADAFSAARRRGYTESVVDWARARPAGQMVFVAGDFNFELAAVEQSNLYTDSAKHDGEAYNHLLKYFRDLGREAGDTAVNDRRIDYVFGPAESVLLRRAEVLNSAPVGRMDHAPLVVEVSF